MAFLSLLAVCALPAAVADANPIDKSVPQAQRFMRVFGPAAPPYGFVQFCERSPEQCQGPQGQEHRVDATPDRLAELDDINRAVNKEIAPTTDQELYGVTEHWTLPVDRGDCEDYALLKRHILMSRGWPAASLLLTVVRDEKGEGHAILTARTTMGDLILDNKVEAVKLWSRTSYTFVMRQSYLHPRIWVSLDPKDAPSPAPVAGVKRGR